MNALLLYKKRRIQVFKVISTEEEKKTRRKWPYILLFILLLILLLALLMRGCAPEKRSNNRQIPSSSSSENPRPSSSASLDESGSALPGGNSAPSRQEILSQLQKQEVTVTDQVSAQVSFPSGSIGSTGAWTVENPTSNSVIMQCDVVWNGKTVAQSAPIYPGQHIDNITLSQPVTPGNYTVTAAIRYYNKTSKTYLGMADYQIHMSVS
jgi:hypothetical protein